MTATAEELETQIDSVHRQLVRAEEAAAEDPRRAEAEALRKEVVALKEGGKPYAEVQATRDALVATIMSEVNEFRKARKYWRDQLRLARQREMRDAYKDMKLDELRFKRAQFMNEFRTAKAHANAIRREIDRRDTENEAKQLCEAMSDAQKKALFAELLREQEEPDGSSQ